MFTETRQQIASNSPINIVDTSQQSVQTGPQIEVNQPLSSELTSIMTKFMEYWAKTHTPPRKRRRSPSFSSDEDNDQRSPSPLSSQNNSFNQQFMRHSPPQNGLGGEDASSQLVLSPPQRATPVQVVTPRRAASYPHMPSPPRVILTPIPSTPPRPTNSPHGVIPAVPILSTEAFNDFEPIDFEEEDEDSEVKWWLAPKESYYKEVKDKRGVERRCLVAGGKAYPLENMETKDVRGALNGITFKLIGENNKNLEQLINISREYKRDATGSSPANFRLATSLLNKEFAKDMNWKRGEKDNHIKVSQLLTKNWLLECETRVRNNTTTKIHTPELEFDSDDISTGMITQDEWKGDHCPYGVHLDRKIGAIKKSDQLAEPQRRDLESIGKTAEILCALTKLLGAKSAVEKDDDAKALGAMAHMALRLLKPAFVNNYSTMLQQKLNLRKSMTKNIPQRAIANTLVDDSLLGKDIFNIEALDKAEALVKDGHVHFIINAPKRSNDGGSSQGPSKKFKSDNNGGQRGNEGKGKPFLAPQRLPTQEQTRDSANLKYSKEERARYNQAQARKQAYVPNKGNKPNYQQPRQDKPRDNSYKPRADNQEYRPRTQDNQKGYQRQRNNNYNNRR